MNNLESKSECVYERESLQLTWGEVLRLALAHSFWVGPPLHPLPLLHVVLLWHWAAQHSGTALGSAVKEWKSFLSLNFLASTSFPNMIYKTIAAVELFLSTILCLEWNSETSVWRKSKIYILNSCFSRFTRWHDNK